MSHCHLCQHYLPMCQSTLVNTWKISLIAVEAEDECDASHPSMVNYTQKLVVCFI